MKFFFAGLALLIICLIGIAKSDETGCSATSGDTQVMFVPDVATGGITPIYYSTRTCSMEIDKD